MADVASSTITIAAPPDQVLAVIADIDSYPEWTGQIKSASVVETTADGMVRLAVADQGHGLPAGFDPAATTGLGMRILRALLRGGDLSVDPASPHTRFVATLPLAPDHPVEPE